MIRQKSTVSALISRIMRKTDKSLGIIRLKLIDIVNKDASGKITVTRRSSMSDTAIENDKLIRSYSSWNIDNNLIFPTIDTAGNKTGTKSYSLKSRVKPTLDIIQLDYSSGGLYTLLHGFYLNPEDLGVYYPIEEEEKMTLKEYYVCTRNSRYYKTIEEVPDYEKLIHYSILGNSPSGERRKYALAGSDLIDWESIIDKATDSFYSLNKGEKSFKQMSKESSKLYQCLAGSKDFGKCNCIAIYFGKFNQNKFDGMCYGSSESLVEHIKETTGIDIHYGAANGMFIQGRIAQGKYGYITLPNNMIYSKIRFLDKDYIHYTWDEIKEYRDKLLTDKEIYENKVVIIGDIDKPIDILMDSNTLKSIYDYSIRPEYTVLRVLKNNSPCHFSSTIFCKCNAKNHALTMKTTYKLFQYANVETARKQLKGDGRVLGLETFDTDNIFLRDALVGAFPEYSRRDKNIAYDVVKNVVESANKSIGKLNIPIKGAGKGIVVGPENLSTECLLGEHEMYNRQFERMFTELGIPESEWKIAAFKYPTMDIDEYDIYNIVSFNTIKQRIKDRIRAEHVRNIIEHEYAMYQDSILVVPCCESFKEKHAGSDFDTDMMQCPLMITDKALEIIAVNKPDEYKEYQLYNNLYHILEHEEAIVKIVQ